MEELRKRLKALNGSEKCWAAAVFCITVKRSLSISGRTTCVSGSPKRQLYSMTFGPSFVSIKPK